MAGADVTLPPSFLSLQGSPASVMEYVPGGSLRAGLQALAALGGVPERLRVAAALQAARGALSF